MKISQIITLAEKFELEDSYFKENLSRRESFIKRWPLESIKGMTVEDYADTFTKDSFIYWLERKLGGIGGGNASKFGIYRNNEGRFSEGVGLSRKDLEGEELENRFNVLKSNILEAIEYVEKGEISKLNETHLQLWTMILNKILSVYFPDKFINIVADKVINAIASDLEIEEQSNSIVTNHLINEKLMTIDPFPSWSKERLSSFLWETYNPRVFRNYYVIGSKYGGHEDKFPEMLKGSFVTTGFAKEHNLQNLLGAPQKEIKEYLESIGLDHKAYLALRYFLNLKPGDWVAVKSDGSPKGNQPFLSIVGIAEVVEDENFYVHDPEGLGQKIKVKFIKAPVHKEFKLGGYGATMHKVTNNNHVDTIFFSDYEEKQDEKSLLINIIIRKYKNLIKSDNNVDEIYKWKLVKDFQSKWNIDAPNFPEVLKSIQFENLNYQNSSYLIRNSSIYPEEVRSLFKRLFDENSDLKSRIGNFQADSKEIFRKYLPDKNHSQDERAIATYLTFRYPEKYSFYKSSYYGKFLNLLGEEPKEAGEKFLHYLKIVDEIKRNYVLKDKELLELSDSTLDETCYDDKERNILMQDILYRVLDGSDFLKEFSSQEEITEETEPDELPINLILHGPPGTGKTYLLRNYYFNKFTSKQSTKTKEEFLKEIADSQSWWQVISIAVLDIGKCKVNSIFEHPLVQAKVLSTNTKTPKNTIWGTLQMHTVNDCPNVGVANRAQPLFFWKDEDGKWSINKEIVKNEVPELFETLDLVRNFSPSVTDKKRFLFTSFHQAYSYEDFIEGIKPVLNEDDALDKNIGFSIVEGVFKKIVKQATSDPNNSYALFIDEINRGNVANIFGELITLIEEDKREGAANELKVTLPYSKQEFSVPKNLHIIGTMNTADRSVEALDTALRRRFSFREITPSPELIENHPDLETDLQVLLNIINQRIERLLDKDHMIGHSYFMGIRDSNNPFLELKRIFAVKILPLLKEYFYGDPMKIGSILGESFIIRKDTRSVNWPLGYEPDDLEIKDAYEIIDPMTFEDETPFISIYEQQN
jgi:5-methylcytosine-specific restriction protein B